MPQRTVWLRREPVGSKTLLPTRDEFRARFARRAYGAGMLAVGALALVTFLRAMDWLHRFWPLLHVLAFVFAVAGVAAAAVALRGVEGRRDALIGLGLSVLALVGALILPALVS